MSSDGELRQSPTGRRPGRLARIRRIRSTPHGLRVLGLGILASLSTLHLVLFRRAKRRLGF